MNGGKHGEKNGILLDTGTNELEVLNFAIDGQLYGINVAKVREIINLPRILRMPQTHGAIDGVFELRGRVIPLISIRTLFALPVREGAAGDRVIVSEFNGQNFAFRVDEIRSIKRLSWGEVESPEDIVALSATPPPITGVIKSGNLVIQMLDFEKIISDIAPEMMAHHSVADERAALEHVRIMLADDSATVRMRVQQLLAEIGIVHVSVFGNGQKIWEMLEEYAKQSQEKGEDVEQHVSMVITDIEMPQMDVFHLVNRMKSNNILKNIPVIIFSSLINAELKEKGKRVGADYQVAKHEPQEIVRIIRERFGQV